MFVSAIASCVGWRAAFVFQKDKPLGNTASVAGVAGKRGRHQMPNKDKLVIGAALATFVKENSWALTQDGTFTNGALKQFCRKYPQLEHRRKDNRFFKRCLGLLGRAGVRSKGKRTSNGALLGRNCKAQAIRDDLFQWFCSIRGSVKGRIPVMLMRTVANSIKERYLIACLRARVVPSAPDVDNKWIARFCKEMCISLRTPNKRWLLPHHMYCDRMRVLWCLGQALPLEWLLFWGGFVFNHPRIEFASLFNPQRRETDVCAYTPSRYQCCLLCGGAICAACGTRSPRHSATTPTSKTLTKSRST